MKRAGIACLVGLCGCFAPTVPEGQAAGGDTDSTDGTTEATQTSEATTATSQSGDSSSSASDTTGTTGNEAPVLTLFLDGDEDPNAIGSHGTRLLSAGVTDDGSVAQVEFFRDAVLIATATSAPYEVALTMSSLDSGARTYQAVATDDGGLTGSDSLDVSINIVGGVVEAVNGDLFSGGIHAAGADQAVGGGVSVAGADVFIAGVSDDDEGVLLRTNTDLEVQWEQRFGQGIRSAPAPTPDGQVAVGVLVDGSWTVRIVSQLDGSTNESWILGPAPLSDGGLGPLLSIAGERLDATENPLDVVRFGDVNSTRRSVLFESDDVVFDLAPSQDGETLFVGYGSVFGANDTPCATTSRRCVAAMSPQGETIWEVGLTDITAGIPHLAPGPTGGVFVATDVYAAGRGSYLLLKVSPSGAIETEARYGEQALDPQLEEGDRVVAAAPHPSGGIVVCGTHGPFVAGLGQTGLTPTPFVALFDQQLNLVWETRQVIEPELGGGYTIGCSATSADVFTYGLRGHVAADDGNPVIEGQAWVARLSL